MALCFMALAAQSQETPNAQQARRVLDRLVGFSLSPLLWRKVKPALSAGRVQSVAVRLIVEREREIQAFKSEEYFRVSAIFGHQNADGSQNEVKAELDNEIADTGEKVRKARQKFEATQADLKRLRHLRLSISVIRRNGCRKRRRSWTSAWKSSTAPS